MRTQEELQTGLDSRAFFSVPETARLFGCDERTVREAVARREIPATRLGCKWFVPTDWLRQQTRPPAGRAA
jgi:excisionase family DNA binding protein